MNDGLRLLDDGDVAQVVRLVESLEKSEFDFLELKFGDLEVILGKGDRPDSARVTANAPAASAPAAVVAPVASVPVASVPAPAAPAQPAAEAAPAVHVAGPASGVDVPAPLMGVFYTRPEPGAPAFVSVGSTVSADTTVALIEVMKTFAPVAAGIDGTIVEILVVDAQLVEYGQALFRIEPATAEG